MDNTNTQALRECPFCGHLPDPENYIDSIYPLNREKTLWTAGCVDNEGGCNASSLGGSREEAIDNWNRRVSQSPAPEQSSGEPDQQAQGEPKVVARVDDLERGGRVRALAMHLGLDDELVTLQSHREAIHEWQEAAAGLNADVEAMGQAIAKKDTALQACVDSWDKYWQSGRTEADAIEFVLAINNARKELK